MLHEGKDRLFTDIAYDVPVLDMIQQRMQQVAEQLAAMRQSEARYRTLVERVPPPRRSSTRCRKTSAATCA